MSPAIIGMCRTFVRNLQSFPAARAGSTAVEFAFCGLAFFAFIFGIVNLGLLGYRLSAMAYSVQQTARWAAVQASASYARSTSSFTLPCLNSDISAFNGLAGSALGTVAASGSTAYAGTQTTGPVTLTASWSTANVGTAPGIYVTLTVRYNWKPFGFALFTNGIPVEITTAATVVGSSNSGTTVASTCS